VKLGGTVATVGFPDIGLQGFSPKLAKGEIASLSGAADDARYFQISVPVQPGNSGGVLVDEHGNVVGVVSAKLDASVARFQFVLWRLILFLVAAFN
jgi:serine protease Do